MTFSKCIFIALMLVIKNKISPCFLFRYPAQKSASRIKFQVSYDCSNDRECSEIYNPDNTV